MFDRGGLLKLLREKHGYTQIEVAKKLNVSLSTVGRWENNVACPSTEKYIELAILYNTSLNCLLGIPVKEKLSIEGLTPEQQNIIQAIVKNFHHPKIKGAEENYTHEQQVILNALFEVFCR